MGIEHYALLAVIGGSATGLSATGAWAEPLPVMGVNLAAYCSVPRTFTNTRGPGRTFKLYGLEFRRTMARWNTEACATLFVRGSNGTCGLSPFILAASNRARTGFTDRAQMQNLKLIP
jgi:hypothetical protein